MKIGVCDVNPAETARTVFLLNSQLRNLKENSRNTERNLKNKADHVSKYVIICKTSVLVMMM